MEAGLDLALSSAQGGVEAGFGGQRIALRGCEARADGFALVVPRDAPGLPLPRVGALASLFAFVGRSAARAADALSIDSGGVARFNGTRNLFTDQENAGDLRVGAAWGVPGIYSEKGAVTVGSESGAIWLRGRVGVSGGASDAKKAPSQSLNVAGTVAADNLVAGSLTAGAIQINGKGQLAFGIGNKKNDAASGTIGYQVYTPGACTLSARETEVRRARSNSGPKAAPRFPATSRLAPPLRPGRHNRYEWFAAWSHPTVKCSLAQSFL